MKTIQRMYDYVSWANEYVLDTIHQNNDNVELLRLFSHILFTEKVWLTRLHGRDSSKLVIWGDFDYEQCAQLMTENKEQYMAYLKSLDEEKLSHVVDYVASSGTAFSNTVDEILNHVALHGQYHRGQINLKLRELGYEPVDVDFITFIRK